MTGFLSILLLQLVSMPGQVQSKNFFSAEEIGAQAVRALNKPKRVVVQGAHSSRNGMADLVLQNQRGPYYIQLFGPEREIPPATVREIITELQKVVPDMSTFCSFRLDHRVSWQSDHGQLDLLICTTCQLSIVYFNGKHVGGAHIYSYPRLVRGLREAFTREERAEGYLTCLLSKGVLATIKTANEAKLEELSKEGTVARERTLTRKDISHILRAWGLAELAYIEREPQKARPRSDRDYRLTIASKPQLTMKFEHKYGSVSIDMGTLKSEAHASSATLLAPFFDSM